MSAPGGPAPLHDRWGRFEALARSLRGPTLAIADARVLRLHPQVKRALEQAGARLVALPAGEKTKSLATVERLARASTDFPRSGTVLAVGGGTVGDVATVFAHLLKRGVALVQVPTTLLAAVDSSVGGKGAVNAGAVKNALGVFHFAQACWLCPELFTTLSEAQRREGRVEALKMAVTLDVGLWRGWRKRAPEENALVRRARALKAQVCAADPFEREGTRVVLNFGHTFGHVLEGATAFRVRHGEAVGLGMLCALDVGRALGVTGPEVAFDVEEALPAARQGRRRLAAALRGVSEAQVRRLLAADKKGGEGLRMVLLVSPGRWTVEAVAPTVWRPLLEAWRAGKRCP